MKAVKVLRNKNGASLIFVLAVLLLLLSIGVSMVAAAGLSVGTGAVRRVRNQLEMYIGSMEQTIKAAMMQKEANITVTGVKTLPGQILQAAYISEKRPVQLQIDAVLPDDCRVTYEITVFGTLNVQETSYKRCREHFYTELDDDGEPVEMSWIEVCVPMTAIINGEARVLIKATYITADGKTYSKATETTYRVDESFIEERITDCRGGNHSAPADEDMYFTDLGKWRVINYERVG